MDIKKFSKKDEEYFKKIDGKTVAVENVLMGDDEDIYDKKKYRYDLSIYDGPLDLYYISSGATKSKSKTFSSATSRSSTLT